MKKNEASVAKTRYIVVWCGVGKPSKPSIPENVVKAVVHKGDTSVQGGVIILRAIEKRAKTQVDTARLAAYL